MNLVKVKVKKSVFYFRVEPGTCQLCFSYFSKAGIVKSTFFKTVCL